MAGGGAEPGERRGGRQKGTPNKATAEVRDLALDHGPAAVAELARLAREAQSEQARIAACNAIIERAYGRAIAGRMIHLDLPDTSTPDGIVAASSVIIQAAGRGEITPGEASDLCGILEMRRRAIELSDMEKRLRRLEGEPA